MTRSAVGAAVLAGAVTGVAGWALCRCPPGGAARWSRSNYRGGEVSLLLGPAVSLGLLAGGARRGRRTGAIIVVTGAAVVGAYDDLYGDRHARGLSGHGRALREGRLTTGLVKATVLVAAGALGTAVERADPVDVALGTVLVAGGANLLNLFDLRPGRAAKVALLLSAGPAWRGELLAGAVAGTALAALPGDLGERTMLGDCGAGALGAAIGHLVSCWGGRRTRLLAAGVIVALTMASERVSFSAVIDRQPMLRALDGLGRAAP